jgi:biopolymer transport protein ExbD
MRRFSQRNSLVTLNEINITPLLDLAFVLLIIFVITTPLLDGSLNLKLPVAGDTKPSPSAKDVVTVESSPDGRITFRGQPVRDEATLESLLVQAYRANPNLTVRIRVDKSGPAQRLYSILDICQRNGITRFSLASSPARP